MSTPFLIYSLLSWIICQAGSGPVVTGAAEEIPWPESSPPVSAAPTETPEAEEEFFDREYLLLGVEIDVIIVEEEIENLVGRGDVVLVLEDMTLYCEKLNFETCIDLMTAWGVAGRPCIVEREDAITRCEKFVYNTQSGETQFIGKPEIELDLDSGNTLISGDNVEIIQPADDSAEGHSIIRITGDARIGSQKNPTQEP